MPRFINKHLQERGLQLKPSSVSKEEKVENNGDIAMTTTAEKINMVNSVLDAQPSVKAKKVKKDKGLLERTESSTIVLTEDNKELLHD